jgi:3-deoxy-7-phosphoheptulonate synthase
MEVAELVENRNVVASAPLPSPAELRRRFPLSDKAARVVLAARRSLSGAIHGRDPRLVVVVGPCSIHDPEAALDYGRRLHAVVEQVGDRLLIVMRTYLEKPRTLMGWKGLVNDPRLDGSCEVASGLEIARRILIAINELGVPCGSELLGPAMPEYVGDLLAWAVIGARTSQSQPHREMASGLPMPVGFKNGVDGSLEGALNGLAVAGQPHTFLGLGRDGSTTIVRTRGNPDRHVVLRGGAGRPNYGSADVARAAALARGQGLERAVLVDCSHDNSGKDLARQAAVCRDMLRRLREGEPGLLGVSLESNLRAGRQAWKGIERLEYGLSITDPCLGWEETEALLREAAEAVARRLRLTAR